MMNGEEKREVEVGYYPKQIVWGGKLIHLDTFYAAQCRGITKIITMAMCFFSLVLVYASQPVQDERGPAIFFCFLGIMISFSILLEYTFMLNTKITANCGFMLEALLYLIMAVGLFTSGIFMIVFCADHWADMNPDWATMPSLAAASLFLCAFLYIVEIGILVSDARRCSWRPSNTFERPPVTTVLPQ